MAAKNAAKPRPGKNSDGQTKRPQPTMTHSISIEPGKPTPPPPAPPTPGAPAPGSSNPMTHPMHPQMQSTLGTAPAAPQPGSAGAPQNPLDQIHPTPTQDNRQVRENIQYKDMNPAEQSQVAQQQGLDPYAPLKMVQQGVSGAIQQGASSGPIPNMLAGPYVPPGIESFPDDMAHLTTLMGQGFAPGASGQEHEFAQNAHAMANAKIQHALSNAQQGAGTPVAPPYAPAQPGGPSGVGYAPGIPEQSPSPAPPSPGPAPAMSSSLGSPDAAAQTAGPPPAAPGAPGGIPPALIAALVAQHKGKQKPVR